MHLAAERGLWRVLHELMSLHDGDPLILDKRRWAALHYATAHDYQEVITLINQEIENRKHADLPAPLPEPIKPPGEE